MKNVSSVKSSSKCESPKTPGGISKALLTPCRRVGLSRNWKKSGPSPFISPLSAENSPKTSGTTPVSSAKLLPKRKKRILEEPDDNEEGNVKNDSGIAEQEVTSENLTALVSTPTRTNTVQLPRRKKSKKDTEIRLPVTIAQSIAENTNTASNSLDKENTENLATEPMSELKIVSATPITTLKYEKPLEKTETQVETNIISKPTRKKSSVKDVKEKSPNNLAKECIVVLQKNILGKNVCNEASTTSKTLTVTSQNLFDSDTDDVPLSSMKSTAESKAKEHHLPQDDDDFVEHKKVKNKNFTTKKPFKTKSKETEIKRTKTQKNKPQEVAKPVSQSSNSFDDDDDFDFDCKRTILIRKSYKKVTKPTKSKTTGSITQKDIDEIKARIKAKKSLLLTKVLTKDTEELRGLIKKWRKGCQDALTELIELMRTKFPDRQNMDYSEILQTLRIPAALVGYDSDNDCFVSPDDANIILSKFQ